MPTYSYRCTECDNAFDIHQAFTDDTLTVCPVCGGKLRKVFSPVGVTFSGSGFYRTDSRAAARSGAGAGASSEASGRSSSEASGTSSSEASGTGSSGSSGAAASTASSSSSGKSPATPKKESAAS